MDEYDFIRKFLNVYPPIIVPFYPSLYFLRIYHKGMKGMIGFRKKFEFFKPLMKSNYLKIIILKVWKYYFNITR